MSAFQFAIPDPLPRAHQSLYHPHGQSRASNTHCHCARCTLPQHPSLRPPIVRLHAAVLTPTSQSQLHQDRNSFDLADDFWRYAHLWTKRFRWYRVHWNRWPLKAPHVCPKLLKRVWVCLCVTRAAESHVRFTTVVHPDMHICCSNNLHMLCICTRGGMGAQDR
jgi:hypothetical protein